MENGGVTVAESVSHSSARCLKMDNKSAGLQFLKKSRTLETAVTDRRDGVPSSSVSGMLRIPAGIWKQRCFTLSS